MFRELKESRTYSGAIIFFCVFSILFGILSGVFGELFLPFAVPFMACLFVFEKPERRILSYCVPALVLLLSYVLSGINAIAALEVVIFSALIAVLYVKKTSKSEVAFYLTALGTVFLVLSLYIGAASEIGSFEYDSVIDFYRTSIESLKALVTEQAASYQVTLGDGTVEQLITAETVDLYFATMVKSAISILIISAFAMTGISLKIFSSLMRKNCKYGILKKFSHFGVNNVISYFYIFVAILSFIVSDKTALDIAIINMNMVLVFVFAYIGLKYLFSLAEFTGRRSFIYTMIAASFLLLGASALRIVSYIGLFVNISINKSSSQFNSDTNKQG